MPEPTAVVVSRGRSNNPVKRELELAIVAGLQAEPNVNVIVAPHLYDLAPDGPSVRALRAVSRDLIVLSWLYPRASFWILDRNGIRGRPGHGQPAANVTASEERLGPGSSLGEESHSEGTMGVDLRHPIPRRRIYCLDLRSGETAKPFLDAIHSMVAGSEPASAAVRDGQGLHPATYIEEPTSTCWRPVIDFSRCTNCMECGDFCLFGVFGVDRAGRILVELPGNCRDGCPACSRVCPENAIMFPQHKTPAIAGSSEAAKAAKLDLSELFGGSSALETAARERDQNLAAGGREADTPAAGGADGQAREAPPGKDELDELIDSLDEFEL